MADGLGPVALLFMTEGTLTRLLNSDCLAADQEREVRRLLEKIGEYVREGAASI